MEKPTEKQIEKAKATLRAAGYLTALWHEDDIICRLGEQDPPIKPTRANINKIKKALEQSHDANFGINWEIIDEVIRNEFWTIKL